MFFNHNTPFNAPVIFRACVTLWRIFLMSLPCLVNMVPRYLNSVQSVMMSPLSISRWFVSVPTDMYFVLAMFMVKPHLEYSSWSFWPVYSKSSLFWAITTRSSANCSGVRLVKLVIAQLVKKSSAFWGTRRFVNLIHSIRPRVPILSQMNSISALASYCLKIQLYIIFPSTS